MKNGIQVCIEDGLELCYNFKKQVNYGVQDASGEKEVVGWTRVSKGFQWKNLRIS